MIDVIQVYMHIYPPRSNGSVFADSVFVRISSYVCIVRVCACVQISFCERIDGE